MDATTNIERIRRDIERACAELSVVAAELRELEAEVTGLIQHLPSSGGATLWQGTLFRTSRRSCPGRPVSGADTR